MRYIRKGNIGGFKPKIVRCFLYHGKSANRFNLNEENGAFEEAITSTSVA